MNTITTPPTDVGMTFQPDLPFEEWSEIGKRFGEATKRFSWALGDWLVYGNSNFKQKVSTKLLIEAEKVTGVDRQSLLSFATVCRRIPMEKRVPHLSFEHHQAISTISNEERRDSWLKFVSSADSPPSKKLLKLSISCSPDDPKIITAEEYESRSKGFRRKNYSPHLRRLFSVLQETVPDMDDDEIDAVLADTRPLVRLLDKLNTWRDGR